MSRCYCEFNCVTICVTVFLERTLTKGNIDRTKESESFDKLGSNDSLSKSNPSTGIKLTIARFPPTHMPSLS
uniref:Uncharacterized protein n=1 Tax=Picea glauca TaxID=3330 RepID=A0A101LY91_PICGL|nr:hypothetical protein ABT39_MTgene5731 [Picea glauca]QHR90663.1 hypothetical protein Q903MT_gene4688 [Picea sitchensis]